MDILYNEYLKTVNNLEKYKERELKENFYYWLLEKKKVLKLYEQFLESMDFTPYKGVIEFDKTDKDSVLPYTPDETKGILISKNVKTQKNKKGIVFVNGEISFADKEELLIYDNNIKDITDIRNYIVELPIDKNTLNNIVELINRDKNVFIGINGKIKDKNYQDKLKELYELKQELSLNLNKHFVGEVVETDYYYFSAITPRLKYKSNKVI